jgi:dipeptidyl aminopeptidase/acylaminoacyl peptidase
MRRALLHSVRMRQYQIEELLHPLKSFGTSFTPDEDSIVYISNESGVLNAFAVPVVGGPPRQLTFSSEHVRYASFGRRDRRLYYTKDCGSQENTHLFVASDTGDDRLLTPGERVQVRFMGWNADHTAFYCATNERDARFFDLYKVWPPGYDRELIYQDQEGLHFCTISKNEKNAAFLRIRSRADSDLVLYDLETRVMKEVICHHGEAYVQPACFSGDSSQLYFLTDEGSEFSYLCVLDLATERTQIVDERPCNIVQMRLSANDKYQILIVDNDGCNRLIIKPRDSDRHFGIPELEGFNISSVAIAESERLMACFAEGDRSPSTLFVYEFALGRLRKLAGGLKPQIESEDLVESVHVRFTVRDGLSVPALLWRPRCATKTNRVPALVWVHGGPGGQTRKGFSARIQFFVNHGYAVVAVNHRGSAGYGKSFYRADERKQGREPLWDCVDAKNYLQSLDYVDPARIGIIGGSFGGYMVLAALAFEPEEFAVGVDICGVSNWLRAFEVLPPYWHTLQRNILRQKVGDPESDRDMLRAISPVFSADRIARPLMVIQGARDPRVKRCEADDIVEAVRACGGTVEYLLFEDEAHALRKGTNAVKAYEAILDFLDRYLRRDRARAISSCSSSAP